MLDPTGPNPLLSELLLLLETTTKMFGTDPLLTTLITKLIPTLTSYMFASLNFFNYSFATTTLPIV